MPTVTTVRTDLRRGINAGAAFKIPCKVATTAAISLSGLQTIDSIAVVADDSVLVKNQADATTNGIYWAASGQWQRRPDFNGYFDAKHGTLVWVNQGTTNALTLWRVSTSDISAGQGPLPDGTSSIAFTEVELGGVGGGGSTLLQGAFSIDGASDTIDLAAEGFTSTTAAEFWVWSRTPSADAWIPVLPASNLGNDPTLATFSISSGDMGFSGLSGFSEGGFILIRQIGAT